MRQLPAGAEAVPDCWMPSGSSQSRSPPETSACVDATLASLRFLPRHHLVSARREEDEECGSGVISGWEQSCYQPQVIIHQLSCSNQSHTQPAPNAEAWKYLSQRAPERARTSSSHPQNLPSAAVQCLCPGSEGRQNIPTREITKKTIWGKAWALPGQGRDPFLWQPRRHPLVPNPI